MKFILPLPLSGFQLRHYRIVTYGKQIYLFVPHSHAILHSFDASGLCPFESSLIAFLGYFDSFFPFVFQFLEWDILNIIYCLPCFLSMGLLLSPPKKILMWDRWSLEIVFQTFWSWVILQGLRQDFNVFIAI